MEGWRAAGSQAWGTLGDLTIVFTSITNHRSMKIETFSKMVFIQLRKQQLSKWKNLINFLEVAGGWGGNRS